ncbi:MAG: zinc ribbon domain-containing protein [Mediterranea sp.]|jgi:hypothetical protein|nr:zinc ribbon domain-containing protein [Mediterranea sp.]
MRQSSTHSQRLIQWVFFSVACLLSLSGCRYQMPDLSSPSLSQESRDSLATLYSRNYTLDTNLEVVTDSISLECLPIKDTYIVLHRGDRVVVADFAVHPADTIDSLWVKLAHTQEAQGWIRQCDFKRSFVPTDSLSEAIYLFSGTHASYFVIFCALFVGAYLFRVFRRKQLKMVYFNDIDSLYPLSLCLLMAFSATIYETMQVFVPDTWEHFYYNPTLSPFRVPGILSLFLLTLWGFVIFLLAALEDIFHQLRPATAFFYLLGLGAGCIFCYFFFIFTTYIYIGYLFLALFVAVYVGRVHRSFTYRYRCGKCGAKLKEKRVCPYCGAIND